MIIDVVVASTSRYNSFGTVTDPDRAEDLSGKIILERISRAGHTGKYQLLPDGIEPIQQAVKSSTADAIVICGGTGLTRLDQTIEAVEPLFEKRLPGFGEIFRWQSMQEVGTRAMLTRATAGVHRKRPVFCLPGSPAAARLGIELILAEIEHILKHVAE
ncbi:MAG: MogA/MoaB family molybdenum cofactor biosynthesis protein [Methanothrix sp.]|jgi:molybdenum cofactor biosynthesis protein B|uniref:MogA/MoaB family molybdenum cofactor biosynthesis protein n=1 Tax=Methanothrix sp. TaxID=90426 RepID=UPI001BD57E7E|nr:MogA/MoaB family molybdenum cofactor biosynthesis protein [Methanothrix sp.]MBK7386436.1 MogA/MoaB family molybdenum cofactor biosynthesis protein [Methanothrix sp.]HPW73638.1 MogA/MoaB family molybdenum cofactor biosynthesis protein [Methanothrix sp.]